MTSTTTPAAPTTATRLVFGCGYLGLRVARRWLAAGERVVAVTRSFERAELLARLGIEPLLADVTQSETLGNLPTAAAVLVAVGYDRASGRSIDDVYVGGLCNLLDRLPRDTGRMVYVSSTGVYGQDDGQWVDEHSPCQPATPGGRAHWAAECLLAAHPLGSRTVVLRMAGLYGPGRIPRRDDLLAGRPIPTPRDGYINLIHVDDAAAVVDAAARRANPPRTYNVSDAQPTGRREYLEELARQLGASVVGCIPMHHECSFDGASGCTLPSVASDGTAAARIRGATNKRVRSDRVLAELGIRLAYPSLGEGLAAIVAESRDNQR